MNWDKSRNQVRLGELNKRIAKTEITKEKLNENRKASDNV